MQLCLLACCCDAVSCVAKVSVGPQESPAYQPITHTHTHAQAHTHTGTDRAFSG